MFNCDLLQVKCCSCGEIAQEPYIECCDCDVNLCTSCFASGNEVRTHKNNHRYSVRKNDFPLFDNCNWTAKEECKLLSALSAYGYGNWEDIAKNVHTRSKLECQEHYKKYYIENVQHKELELLPETEQSLFPKPIVPYLYSTEYNRDPPRNNQTDQHIAGYNAYRSEFELNYDCNAENIFSIEDNYSDEEDNDECMDALKVSLINALNNRLRERKRRYEILENHGLIMPNKLISWIHRYDKTITRPNTERLLAFMQLMTGMQFDALMESLHLQAELLQNILRLCEYRCMGIQTLYGIKLFQKMRKDHENLLKEQKWISQNMSKKFECQSPSKKSKREIMKQRRQMRPLDIVDLPGFPSLNDKERALCSNLRLVPQNYLDFKEQLVSENNKLGTLKLLDARRIIKIDVNKTRKIYDFLVTEGFVNKPL